jgi:hypothetical protein
MDNMFLDETYDLLMCHVSQRGCFGPLGKIIYSNQDEPMTFRRPGCISPIKSSPQPLNDHDFTIGFRTLAGANCKFLNR